MGTILFSVDIEDESAKPDNANRFAAGYFNR
jgi:hypothetical protein